jgi:hypothetical protein
MPFCTRAIAIERGVGEPDRGLGSVRSSLVFLAAKGPAFLKSMLQHQGTFTAGQRASGLGLGPQHFVFEQWTDFVFKALYVGGGQG